jgi:hypothetical protein
MLCVDAGFHIEDKKGLVSQDSSTVDMENFDPVPWSKEDQSVTLRRACWTTPASKISVELIVVGSIFPRLLCSDWVMSMPQGHEVSPQQLLCRKRLPKEGASGALECL